MCRAIGMRVHYRGDFIWFYHPLLSVHMEHELEHVEVDVCVAYSAFSHFSRRRKQKRTKTNSKFGSTIPSTVRVSCNVMPRAVCTVNVDDVHVATVKRQPPVTHSCVCVCVCFGEHIVLCPPPAAANCKLMFIVSQCEKLTDVNFLFVSSRAQIDIFIYTQTHDD